MTPATFLVDEIDVALAIDVIELTLSCKTIVEEERLVAGGSQEANRNDIVPTMSPAFVLFKQAEIALVVDAIECTLTGGGIIEEQSCLWRKPCTRNNECPVVPPAGIGFEEPQITLSINAIE